MKTMDEARLSERKEVLRDFFGGADAEQLSDEMIRNLFQFEELMLKYRCAIREVTTKLEVLNDKLSSSLAHNPIESIQSRIKRPYSIARKLNDLGRPGTVESIAQNLNDVAGIRVICPFINDIYDVAEMLLRQDDVVLISKKDYIRSPKPSGYRSLHLIIEIPVFSPPRRSPSGWRFRSVPSRWIFGPVWSISSTIRVAPPWMRILPESCISAQRQLPRRTKRCRSCATALKTKKIKVDLHRVHRRSILKRTPKRFLTSVDERSYYCISFVRPTGGSAPLENTVCSGTDLHNDGASCPSQL